MSTLADAVTAIRAGRRAEAREMLEHILAVDPCNVNALLWMSEVVPSPKKRRKYLGLILAVDPGNALARKGLDLLNRSAEQPSGVTVPLVPARSATISINK